MSKPITANRPIGRILLALRAGRMTSEALSERCPSIFHHLANMQRAGLIARVDECYVITPAGLQACPSRRAAPLEPLHAKASKPSRAGVSTQGASA